MFGVCKLLDYDIGICLGNVWEGLAEFPEPYETLPSWPAQDDDIECGQGDTDEPKTPEALPGTSEGRAQAATPVVSIPDKNPSCPHCFT